MGNRLHIGDATQQGVCRDNAGKFWIIIVYYPAQMLVKMCHTDSSQAKKRFQTLFILYCDSVVSLSNLS